MADGKVVIDSKVDDSGVTKGLKAIQSKLSGFNAHLIKTAALGSAISIAPSLVPAIAAATAATLALSASMGAAGIGVVAFGAVAVGALGQVFDAADQVAQLEERIANASSAKERIAAQKELAAVYANMSEAQRNTLKELQNFKSFWGDFVKQFEEPIFETFTIGLEALQKLLDRLAPTISNVSDVIKTLLSEFNAALGSSGATEFFGWLETNAAEALYNFTHIAGNLLAGFYYLIGAFSPLGASMEEGLLKLTDRFKEWAQSLSASAAFQTFVDYVTRNGPTLLSVLGNLVGIIVGLGVALSPVGEIALDVLDILTSFLSGDMIGAADSFKRAFGEEALNAVLSFFEAFKSGIESAKPYLVTLRDFITVFVDSSVDRFKMFSAFVIDAFKIIWKHVEPLVMDMLKFFQNKLQQLTQFWKENGDQIMRAVQNAFNFILKVINFIMPAVMFIINDIWSAIKNVINGALNFIMGILKIFAGLFTGDWNKMWDGVKQLLSGAIELIWGLLQLGFLGKIFKVIKTFGGNAVDAFMDMVKGAKGKFDDLVSAAKTKFDDIKEKILSPIRTARDKVKDFIDEIKGFFRGLKLELPKIKMPRFSIKNWSANPVDWIKAKPSLDIEWFKEGGVFPANSPRLVGVGDATVPEAAIPLKPSVLGMIGQKIADTMGDSGNGGFSPQITNYFTPAESTPSEHARQQKKMLQDLAFLY
jgi:phage-related protein